MKYLSLAFVLSILSISAVAQGAPADSAVKLVSGAAFYISAEDEAAGIDGTMKLAVSIDKSGNVSRAVVYVGPSWLCSGDLDQRVISVIRNAEKAVKNFKFSPAVKEGNPVESEVSVSLTIGKAARKAREPKPPIDPNAPKTPKQINGGVINGKALSLPKPPYPLEARAAGASGAVSVQVLIAEDGKVISAQAVSGSPLLHFASRAAACQAKFRPTQLQGNPVKVSGVITYNFVP